MIKYYHAPEIQEQVIKIAQALDINHDFSRVVCVRSHGSQSRYTLARCHALSRIMQTALNTKAHYVIEIISENYDSLPEEEKIKTLIHEIIHIPKAFGGGFRHHNHVTKKAVDRLYKRLVSNN